MVPVNSTKLNTLNKCGSLSNFGIMRLHIFAIDCLFGMGARAYQLLFVPQLVNKVV